MQSSNPADLGTPPTKKMLVITDRDIVFHCPVCQGELVVDRDGAGLQVACSHCENLLTVPAFQPRAATPAPPAAAPPRSESEPPIQPSRKFDVSGLSPEQLERRVGELKHQLKENRSQDTEMRGHVQRATMELHRLQLRLKTLQQRHADVEAELAAIAQRHAGGL